MITSRPVKAVILAAGRSTRMGEQKLLMPFKGMPMVDFVIKTVLSCGFDGTSVVVSQETLNCLTPVEGADYIVNPDPDRGQDSSFHCALSALLVDASFAVFLADKPAVTAEQIMELRRRFELLLHAEKPRKSALVPLKRVAPGDNAPGHPAFYAYLWRERFLSSGESGRATLFRHEEDVKWAESDAYENFFLDVDTPEDYRKINNYERREKNL